MMEVAVQKSRIRDVPLAFPPLRLSENSAVTLSTCAFSRLEGLSDGSCGGPVGPCALRVHGLSPPGVWPGQLKS